MGRLHILLSSSALLTLLCSVTAPPPRRREPEQEEEDPELSSPVMYLHMYLSSYVYARDTKKVKNRLNAAGISDM